jgi:hypothetical protein
MLHLTASVPCDLSLVDRNVAVSLVREDFLAFLADLRPEIVEIFHHVL